MKKLALILLKAYSYSILLVAALLVCFPALAIAKLEEKAAEVKPVEPPVPAPVTKPEEEEPRFWQRFDLTKNDPS